MIARPSRRGSRPRALDFSFGIEDPDDSATTSASDASRKRDRGDTGDADLRGAKRRNLDAVPRPIRKYEPRPYEVVESDNLFIFGEEQDPPDDGRKRTRVLSHFTFFDDHHDNNMISLDVLDEGMGGDNRVLAAGFVVARYEIDEDEGQEDDLDVEAERQYIRTSRILRYFTRYWEANSPFCVETDHAIYELDVLNPSKKYRSQFRPFWKLQKILRLVISSAANEPEREFSAFAREYNHDDNNVLGQALTERELWDAVPKLRETLETVPNGDDLRASIVIHHLLSRLAPVIFKPVGKRKEEAHRMRDLPIEYKGNLDLAVLRSKTPTHVTPRISQMAIPLFREVLQVVGPRPRAEPEVPKDDLIRRLQGFLIRTQARPLVQFRPDQRLLRSRWLKHILIDALKYEVGDTVLFYPGQGIPPNPNNIPPTDTLADHFW
jgi:DNA (cytosine-5)-methyltransferase 1